MLKNRTFIKYFISYMVLLIIAFSILTFIFINIMNVMRKEVESSTFNNFKQIGDTFEKELASLKNTVDLMYTNEHLTKYRLSNNDDYMAYTGIKELKKIRASNSLIDDVLICYKDDYVFSAKGKVTIDVFTEMDLLLDEKSTKIVSEALLSEPTEGFYSLYQRGRTDEQPAYLMFCTSMKSKDYAIANVGFIISSNKIIKIISSLLGEHGSGVKMSLPSGEVFTQVNRADAEDPFQDTDMMLYSYRTSPTSFAFDVAINSKSVFSRIWNLQKTSYGIIIGIFLLSVLLSYIFSKKHYRPIKMLAKKAIEYHENIPINTSNEFDTILEAMNYEFLENKKLSDKLNESSFALRQQACLLLYSGVEQDEERIRNLIDISGIKIGSSNYSVMVIIPEGVRNDGRKLTDICTFLMQRYGTYYITKIMDRVAIIATVMLRDLDLSRKQRLKIAGDLAEAMNESNLSAYICFSRVSNDINFLSRSFSEAKICSEHCLLLKQAESILFFEDFAQMDSSIYCFSDDDINELTEKLETREFKQIMDCFGKLVKKLHSKGLSLEAQHFHYHDLLHEIFHYFLRNGMDLYAEQILKVDCSSSERFLHCIKKLFKYICREDTGASQLNIEKIIGFMEENYSNYEMSLAYVARHFNVTPNYLSKYFKDMTGESYIQYLSSLRIKEAYRLIYETDMTIQDITMKVGYLDPVNFTKKFKKTYRVTPTELRQKRFGITGANQQG